MKGCVKVHSDPANQDIPEWGEPRTSNLDTVTSTPDLAGAGRQFMIFIYGAVTKKSLRTARQPIRTHWLR